MVHNDHARRFVRSSIRSRMEGSTMLLGDGPLFNVWQLGRRVCRITLLLVSLTAGLFLLGVRPCFAQTSLMAGAPGTGVTSPLGVGTESTASPCPGGGHRATV